MKYHTRSIYIPQKGYCNYLKTNRFQWVRPIFTLILPSDGIIHIIGFGMIIDAQDSQQ